MADAFILDFINEKADRIDKILAEQAAEHSRSYWQKMVQSRLVTVDGEIVDKVNTQVVVGAHIQVRALTEKPLAIIAEDIPLDIVYQDEDIAVINKRIGMVVHPGFGHPHGTLVHALLYHIKDLSSINGVIRPGIVHRIDKDTSGLLVIAKNDAAHVYLTEQLKDKSLYREYIALVHGEIKEQRLTIDLPIGRHPELRTHMAIVETGKQARTHIEVMERYRGYTLVRCQLETGRTHQIRVHLQSIGFPIVGDPVYTKKQNPFGLKTQFLHAYKLGFIHPRTAQHMMYTADLPEPFQTILQELAKTQ